VLIGNGCLCCVLRSDLQKTLMGVLADRARGELAPFQQIILETSGLADPVPILQTLTADRGLASQIHVQAVVTVVDAVLGRRTLEQAPEARRQVAVADRIIVTKSDITGEPDTIDLEQAVAALAPSVAITRAHDGTVPPEVILADNARTSEPVYPASPARHSCDIDSFVLRFSEPLHWTAFELAMDMLARLRGADVLRAKGLLAVEGCKGPVVVHQVQHLGAPPVELEDWPGEDRTSRLVFITRGLARADVEVVLALAQKLAREARPEPDVSG